MSLSQVGKFIVDLSRRNFKKMPFNVIVEGNIGSGKTTFLEHFNKFGNVCVRSEPIDKWRNCNGHNLLGLLYEDIHKWSFSFQSYVLLTMAQQHMEPTPCPIKLMERSVYSARYCFIEKMKTENLLPAPSAAVLDEWFNWLTENQKLHVDLIVYLRTSPEIVYERMQKRNRAEEKSVSLDYLKDLHDIHEKWLYDKTLGERPAPVLVLNADLDRSVMVQEYEKYETRILNKVAVQA